MGEIADAIISGEMCEMCGAYLENNDMGICMYCSERCALDRGVPKNEVKDRILKEMAEE